MLILLLKMLMKHMHRFWVQESKEKVSLHNFILARMVPSKFSQKFQLPQNELVSVQHLIVLWRQIETNCVPLGFLSRKDLKTNIMKNYLTKMNNWWVLSRLSVKGKENGLINCILHGIRSSTVVCWMTFIWNILSMWQSFMFSGRSRLLGCLYLICM